MDFILGLLIGTFVGAGLVGAFMLARAAHRFARAFGEQMRGLKW